MFARNPYYGPQEIPEWMASNSFIPFLKKDLHEVEQFGEVECTWAQKNKVWIVQLEIFDILRCQNIWYIYIYISVKNILGVNTPCGQLFSYDSRFTCAILMKLCPKEQNLVANILKLKFPPWAISERDQMVRFLGWSEFTDKDLSG